MTSKQATESTRAKQSKAREPRTTDYAYDDQALSSREFFLAVMHASNLPLHQRMEAAETLITKWPELYGPGSDYAPACIIQIPEFIQ
jgi:hypothetical protein